MENPIIKPGGGPGAAAEGQQAQLLEFYHRPLIVPRGDGGREEISLIVVTDIMMTSALTVRELVRLGDVSESTEKIAKWRDRRTPELRKGYVEAVQSLAIEIVETLRQYGLTET